MSAEWIRGRVHLLQTIHTETQRGWFRYRTRVRVYEWGAINTRTGEWICRDNSGCTLAEAIDRASEDVHLARAVWRRGIRYGSTRGDR